MVEFIESIRYEADIADVKTKLAQIDRAHGDSAGSSESATGRMRTAWGKVTSSVGGVIAEVGKIGIAAAGAATAVGAAAIGKGFMDALGAQDNAAMIEARLGVPPERAAELGRVAASAYRDAWGATLEETTGIVTALQSSFDGLDDSQLEALTGRAAALGQAFELDVAQGVQTASELVESGLAKSADEAFDLLTRGLQEMPQGIRDELLAATQEYGDFFGDLGLSGDVAFAKLTEYAEGGIYGIDKFGDALKELTIRGTDMSDASVKAYEKAGLSAEDMAARFLAGGDEAREAVEETARGLLKIEDPVERANAAIALFGTPLEDLSNAEIPGFLNGLTDLSTGLDGVDGAAQSMADSLGGTTSLKLEAFKRKALGGLADFAAEELLPRFEQVVAWTEEHWPEISAVGEEVLGRVRDVAGSVIGWVQENWPQIRDTLVDAWEAYKVYWESVVEPVFNGIIDTIDRVVAWVRENWPQIRATIAEFVDWLQTEAWPVIEQIAGFIVDEWNNLVAWVQENWPEIQHTIEGVMESIQIIIDKVVKIATEIWEHFGDDFIALAENSWETIKEVVQAAIDIVRGIIDTVTSLIRGDWDGAWEGIKTALGGVWDGIKAIVSGALDEIKILIGAVWEEVDGLFSDAWNGIKGTFSDLWDGIKSTVSDGIDDIVGFVTGLPGRIEDVAYGAFDSIKNAFRDAINWIIGKWNGLSFSIPGVDTHIPGVGKIGGFTISTPNIPLLATGGVVYEPVLAVVGDNPGARFDPEIVAPQSTIRDTVRDAIAELGGFGQPMLPASMTVVIEGRPFRAAIKSYEFEQRGAA